MKVWITKYALTQGIFEVDGEAKESSTLLYVPKIRLGTFDAYYHKPDWHETKEEAVAQAEKMRVAKLKSLEKQVAKIRTLQF